MKFIISSGTVSKLCTGLQNGFGQKLWMFFVKIYSRTFVDVHCVLKSKWFAHYATGLASRHEVN